MIRVVAVGDLMLGDSSIAVGFGVHGRYPGDALAECIAPLAERLQGSDLVIGNLESPLAAVGAGNSPWARDQMRGDEAYARVLRAAGFTALAVANNHAVQHGDAAFARTVAALRDAGLLVLGLRGEAPWHSEPVTFTRGDTSVAMLAYSWRPRQYGHGIPPYATVDEEKVLADVARARSTHDAVIISLHWGEEFVVQPSIAEVTFAHAVVDAGADLVLGHHPHVVRPLELRKTSAIAYSLGNCVTDMLWLDSLREGAILETELSPRPNGTRLLRLRIDDDYRPNIGSVIEHEARLDPLDAPAYRTAIAAGQRRQRMASYRYLVRNAWRYRVGVLATLVTRTVVNKVNAAVGRDAGADA